MSSGSSISIVIPTYNGARHLACALRSVLSQTLRPRELIVSDSGSCDRTLEIVARETAGADFPVRVLPRRTPGMVRNWNIAAAAARGEYIKFLFQDDLLHDRCLERMMELAREDASIGFVFCARKLIGEQGVRRHPSARWLLDHEDLDRENIRLERIQDGRRILGARLLLEGSWNKIGEPTTVMIRRSLFERLGGFNERLKQLVDLELWVRAMAVTRVGFLAEPLASFRVHFEQMTLKNIDSGADRGDWLELMRLLARPDIYNCLHMRARRKVREELSRASGEAVPENTILDRCYTWAGKTKWAVQRALVAGGA